MPALGIALALAFALVPGTGAHVGGAAADSAAIRVNHLGYLPSLPKVAVLCSTAPLEVSRFDVLDDGGVPALGPLPAERGGGFGPCAVTYRLDFTALRREGTYRIRAGALTSPPVRVSARAYDGSADTLLHYLRQQRSGWNPLFRDSVHHRTDGILVDHPDSGRFIPVAGGWADAADYLQYVTTSAHATFSLLIAWRDLPGAFGDAYDARGLPGPNGTADVLDEARHGLAWLSAMHPEPGLILNQLGDDRDHVFFDLPTTDSSDYGWGKGGFRPVYPCTGEPQGLLQHRNRSDGLASTAGKLASAFALAARLLREDAPSFAETLATQARSAYALGRAHPGRCQTAPARAPYFYEEQSWADDMELAAAELFALSGEAAYLDDAIAYAGLEPVTPWMGADTARHYEWFPWHNNGHYEVWRALGGAMETRAVQRRERMTSYYRRGLERVAARAAENGFRAGIPFIWCSNNLMASLATQAVLYRRMSGDRRFLELETAAVDWLLGTNPWGTSMVIGFPEDSPHPRDPHSVVARELGYETQKGGLVDGPVYRSIFEALRGIRLSDDDEYAVWNTGRVVFHDDFGDYSTNEPIMDGTANLVYPLAARALEGRRR